MKNSYVIASILVAAAVISGIIVYTKNTDNAVSETGEPVLQHVHGFAVDINDADRLLIATHHGLLQYENNKLSQIGTVADDLMGFTPHPTEADIYFSSGHPTRGGNLGFQKSTDGGIVWEKVSDGVNGPVDFHSMTISTANPNVLYGYFGDLQRSTDGGTTWEWAKGKVQPYSLSSDPQRENVLYAATPNGVQVSEDRGDTWKSLTSQLEGGAVSVFVLNPEGTEALSFSQALGGLGKSIDGGITWTSIQESFGKSAVMFIAYSKTQPSVVFAITQANTIYKSTDAGETWTKIR